VAIQNTKAVKQLPENVSVAFNAQIIKIERNPNIGMVFVTLNI